MRVPLITLAVTTLVSTGLTAEAQRAAGGRHSLLPARAQRLSVDFGMKRAMTTLPGQPAPCVPLPAKKHSHGLMAPQPNGPELLKTGHHAPRSHVAPPCPVR